MTMRFGVATAGFQIEGGYNGPGEPQNNWAEWEHEGRVEPSGIALDFWNDYERQLDRAAAAGCDSFRMSIEWARCEPAEGQWDDTAFARYVDILGACAARGMQPLVSVHHFTHPAWLGADFWLQTDAPERFAAWTDRLATAVAPLVRDWVTINEINVYGLQTYLTGMFPPGGRLHMPAALRSMDNMLTAHVLAYEVIHRHRPDALVSTNNYTFDVYEVDRLLVDLLLARSHDVYEDRLPEWLEERKRAYYDGLATPRRRSRVIRRLAASSLRLDEAFPRARAAIFASEHSRPIDVVQIDHYNPAAATHLRLPGHRTAGGRNWTPGRLLWDDPPNPRELTRMCRLNAEVDLEVWVVENGLCNRVCRGVAYPRLDGWNRVRYVREHIAAVMDAVDEGVPVTGYWHWCLADNYEWGSYEPRFGLYGVERERGVRWSERDSMGDDAAGAYRRIAEGLRAGDRSVLA